MEIVKPVYLTDERDLQIVHGVLTKLRKKIEFLNYSHFIDYSSEDFLYSIHRTFQSRMKGGSGFLRKTNTIVEGSLGVNEKGTSNRYANRQRESIYRSIDNIGRRLRLRSDIVQHSKCMFSIIRNAYSRVHKIRATILCCVIFATEIFRRNHPDISPILERVTYPKQTTIDRILEHHKKKNGTRTPATTKDKWCEFLQRESTLRTDVQESSASTNRKKEKTSTTTCSNHS